MFEKFAKFFLENHKITLVIITAITFFGLLSYLLLPKQYNPSIVAPAFEIKVPVPGYSSSQSSTFVVQELENRIKELPRVDKLYGYASEGYASVTVAFEVGTDLEEAKTRIHDKLISGSNEKPYGVAGYDIRSIDPEDLPQLVLGLTMAQEENGGKTEFVWKIQPDLQWNNHSQREINSESLKVSWESQKTNYLSWETTKSVSIKPLQLTSVEQGIYLRSLALELKESFKQVSGTSRIEVLGWYSNSLEIQLSPDLLKSFSLDAAAVIGLIRGEFGEKSIGMIDTWTKKILVNVAQTSLESLRIPLSDGETTISLSQIATISVGPSEPTSWYFIQEKTSTPQTAVFLAVSKERWKNAVTVVESALEELEKIEQKLPKNVKISIIQNEGETAKEATSELIFHLVLSILIVFAVLIAFLGFKNALNAAFCIPMVLGIVFVIAFIFGIDINRITLFALILSLGILVDDSIVVVENNARHLTMMTTSGRTKKQALLDSVREVSVSIVLSTVTRILSFLGMFAVTGMMGDYMKPIPVFASIALTASLFVAFSINPFLASILAKKHGTVSETRKNWRVIRILRKLFTHEEHEVEGKVLGLYTRLITHFTGRSKEVTRRRKLLTPTFWIALGLVVVLPIMFDVFRVRMLPKADKDQIYLWVDLPRNTSLDVTKRVAEYTSSLFFSGSILPEELQIATRTSVAIGDRFVPDFPNLFRGSQDRRWSHQLSMKVDIAHFKDRDISSEEYVIALRPIIEKTLLSTYPQATLRLLEDPPGPPTMATLHVKLKGETDTSSDSLVHFADTIESVFRGMADERYIEDISNTTTRALEKITIRLDSDKMRERGVERMAVEGLLGAAMNASVVWLLDVNVHSREPQEIRIAFPKKDITPEFLKDFSLRSQRWELVKLGEIATIENGFADKEIYTENREKTIHLYAEMGANSVVYPVLASYSLFESEEMKKQGYEKVSANPYGMEFRSTKDGKTYRLEWGGEWELTMDTFRDMGLAMILSLLAIYFLVVAEFKSFRAGGIVMMAFLFSFFGIFPGFALLYVIDDIYFTATAMIGAIALGGIVVGNAIILLDYIEQLYHSGKTLEESVIEGAKKRFIPVMLTSIAAVLGSIIIASDPVWSGLAWAIVFGLSASALLTLFLVPVFYYDLALRKELAWKHRHHEE